MNTINPDINKHKETGLNDILTFFKYQCSRVFSYSFCRLQLVDVIRILIVKFANNSTKKTEPPGSKNILAAEFENCSFNLHNT